MTSGETIRQIASEWVVRMDSAELTAEEMKALLDWLGESAAHRKAFRELSELWGLANGLAVLSEMIPMEEKAKGAWSRPRRFTHFFKPRLAPLTAAALLLLATALLTAYGVMNGFFTPGNDNLYVTAVGETRTLALRDGSTVTMNTDTQLEVDYSSEVRRLVLKHGEAEFRVSKDPHRPFVVFVGEGSVRAVGTAFNVYYSVKTVDVLVTEGAVEITSPAASAALPENGDKATGSALTQVSASAGEAVNFDEIIRSVKQLEQDEIDRRLAWKNGLLLFDNDRLEDVIEQVTRYTETKIVINDPTIGDMAVGGYFRTGEVNGMLFALETSFDIEVTRVNDKLVLLARKGPAAPGGNSG